MDIRKLIRETINEMMLSEAAITASEILSNPNVGLALKNANGFKMLVIYDYKIGRALGMITCRNAEANIIQSIAVAAEKGYGPIMYEFAMMAIYNNFLVPTRDADIRGGAYNVWEKFMDRQDIEKLRLEEGDPGFSEDYYDMGDEAAVIGNTACRKAPSAEYHALLKKGQELGTQYKISDIRVFEDGNNYFGYKYADS